MASDTTREKQCGSECQQKVWPFIIPDVFNGDLSVNWDEWIDHFESAVRVNGWDNGTHLKWLEVRLTAKARNAWKCPGDDVKTRLQQLFNKGSNQKAGESCTLPNSRQGGVSAMRCGQNSPIMYGCW